MIVQVVPGQVGEDPAFKPQAGGAPLVQSVGGGLHHHVGAARPLHLLQQALEGVRVRGGPPGGKDRVPDQVLVGADEAHLGPQHLLQDMF